MVNDVFPLFTSITCINFQPGATEIAVTVVVVVVVGGGVVGVVGVTCKIWKGKENQKNGKKS